MTLNQQCCSISELVNQAIQELQTMAVEAQVAVNFVPCNLQVFVDAQQIVQLLVHLLHNAIKVSPQGSSIGLTVELSQHPGYTWAIPNPYVIVRVQDTGPGISFQDLQSAFDQDPAIGALQIQTPKGVGQGLAISRQIAQQHQGHLWVESSLSAGSSFYLALPLQQQPL